MRVSNLLKVLLLGIGIVWIITSCSPTLPDMPPVEVDVSYRPHTNYGESAIWIYIDFGGTLQRVSQPAQAAEHKLGMLVEVPTTWKSLTNTGAFTTTLDVTGTMKIADVSTFEPPSRGPIVTDPGYKAIVLYPEADFPIWDMDVVFKLDPGRFAARCFVLKGVFVDLEFEGSNRRLEILDSEPDPNFPLITDSDHVSPLLDCPTPPPLVELASFTSTVEGDNVILVWEALSEHGNIGFNVYRSSTANGPTSKVNEALIPSEGSPIRGAQYRFVDTPGAGTFFYKLEYVSRAGATIQPGAIEVALEARVYLPIVTR